MEQDRAPPVLPHHAELARPAADRSPRRGRADRRDDDQNRPEGRERARHAHLPKGHQGQRCRDEDASTSPAISSILNGTTRSGRGSPRNRSSYCSGWPYDAAGNPNGGFVGLYTVTWDGIENLSGGSGKDVITGDNNDNILDGGSGDDTIYAGVGNDTVHGGQGNDTLSFADISGDLTLDLAAGKDTYVDGGTLYDASGSPNGGFVGLYTVTWDGIENLTGGSGKDVITGDSNNNTLDGGAGINTAVFHGPRSGYTITSLADGDLQVADSVAGRDGTDLLKNIQNLQFSDGEFAAADIATQAQMQSIDGLNVVYADPSSAASGFHFALAGTGANAVFGGAGNDVLDASGTADYDTMLYGGAGNDTLIPGSAGSYTLQGGAGDDTAVFSGKQSDYTIDGSPVGWPSWATVTDNATGAVNWLQSVEHLQFADGTIDTPGLPSGGDFTNVLFLDSSNPPASIGPNYDTVYVDDSQGPNPVHLNLAGTNVSFAYGGLGSDVFDATGVTSSSRPVGPVGQRRADRRGRQRLR